MSTEPIYVFQLHTRKPCHRFDTYPLRSLYCAQQGSTLVHVTPDAPDMTAFLRDAHHNGNLENTVAVILDQLPPVVGDRVDRYIRDLCRYKDRYGGRLDRAFRKRQQSGECAEVLTIFEELATPIRKPETGYAVKRWLSRQLRKIRKK